MYFKNQDFPLLSHTCVPNKKFYSSVQKTEASFFIALI